MLELRAETFAKVIEPIAGAGGGPNLDTRLAQRSVASGGDEWRAITGVTVQISAPFAVAFH